MVSRQHEKQDRFSAVQ